MISTCNYYSVFLHSHYITVSKWKLVAIGINNYHFLTKASVELEIQSLSQILAMISIHKDYVDGIN